MAWNFTENLTNIVNVGSGMQLLDEGTSKLYQRYYDEVGSILSEVPVEGSNYFKIKNVDKNNYKSVDTYGLGVVEANSDAEELPIQKQIMGFEQTISNHVFRTASGITREALETDRSGAIGDFAKKQMQAAKKTNERIMADVFNRGFGSSDGASTASSNLALLAEDGLALFSGSRPQPRASAGEWSNLFTTGSLTATAVANARTQFMTYVDGNGDLAPQKLTKVIVSPELADTMKEISGTSLKVDTSLNTTNVVAGQDYEVWSYLNANTVIYCGDEDNGLEWHIRKNPETMTWQDGSNPDKIMTRVRFAVGAGCKRPSKFIGQLTP